MFYDMTNSLPSPLTSHIPESHCTNSTTLRSELLGVTNLGIPEPIGILNLAAWGL